MLHGILIKDGTLKEVDIEDRLSTYYDLLGCNLIDIVERRIAGKTYSIVCDDEGLYNNDAPISAMDIQTNSPMLVGSLLIANDDHAGSLCDLTEEDVQAIKENWKHKVIWGSF